jgi:hypothetical protein
VKLGHIISTEGDFDWEGDAPPNTPTEDMIVSLRKYKTKKIENYKTKPKKRGNKAVIKARYMKCTCVGSRSTHRAWLTSNTQEDSWALLIASTIWSN